MKRRPEPELMESEEQARAYAGADFSGPHDFFADEFARFAQGFRGAVLDLGCGPGDVLIRLARRLPRCRFHGVDGSAAMLRQARRRLRAQPAALQRRVILTQGIIPRMRRTRRYGAIVSNSLLHHLARPADLWESIRRYGRAGARVFIMDLRRPLTIKKARGLCRRYAANEPAILKRDFFHSLCAAYTAAEVRAQLNRSGLRGWKIDEPTDRHLTVRGILK